MRSILPVMAMVFMAVFTVRAQVPRMICETPEFDFGQAAGDAVIEHVFELRNTGDAQLLIKAIRPDCGCTSIKADNLEAPPGGIVQIHVRLSLKGLTGRVRKRLIVESNDPLKPLFTLTLTGTAVPGVELRPERISLGAVTIDSNDIIGVDINFRTNRPIHILYADVTSPFFSARIEKPLPGFQHRVSVRAIPPLQPGLIQTALVILTDHPEFPRLEVPIIGRAVASLYVTPEEIVFEPSSEKLEYARLLVVRSLSGSSFEITDVQTPQKNARARKQAIRGGAYRIDLRFQPTLELDGQSLTIFTDCPKVPELIVPFRVLNAWKNDDEPEKEQAKPEETP